MNVLSLFDGISCGKIALRLVNIPVENYYASEIDKYAISVSKYNHPGIVQLGDIRNWQQWQLPHIDMIIGGSPCQGFSNAGNGLNFLDERSKLFFVFVDILKALKPKYFLLENVRMKQEWQDVISEYMQVKPILVDSALVSAQSRKRLYWTNIPDVILPLDKGLLLQDIIEDGFIEIDKSYCIDFNYYKGCNLKEYLRKNRRQIIFNNWKSIHSQNNIINSAKCIDEKSNTVTTWSCKPNSNNCANLFYTDLTWRKLTPIECERLQTLPDNYTQYGLFEDTVKPISNSQRYKMLGNGWTVDVIAHIFSFIKGA